MMWCLLNGIERCGGGCGKEKIRHDYCQDTAGRLNPQRAAAAAAAAGEAAAGAGAGAGADADVAEHYGLLGLPSESLAMIFHFLNTNEIFRILPQVCRSIRALVGSNAFVRAQLGREAARLVGPASSAPAARAMVAGMLKGCALFPVLPERAMERDFITRLGERQSANAFDIVVDTAQTSYSSCCFRRPLPESFYSQPATTDIARGQEKWPVTINTHLKWGGMTLACALPEVATPWAPLVGADCSAHFQGSDEREDLLMGNYNEIETVDCMMRRQVVVKVLGLSRFPHMNGSCGKIVDQTTDGSSSLATAYEEGTVKLIVSLLDV